MLTTQRPAVHNFNQHLFKKEKDFIKKLQEGNRFSPCLQKSKFFDHPFDNGLAAIPELEWIPSDEVERRLSREENNNCHPKIEIVIKNENAKSKSLVKFLEKQDAEGRFTLSYRNRLFQTFTEPIELCLCELDDLSHKYNFDFWIVDEIMNTIIALKYLQINFKEEKMLWMEEFENGIVFIDSFITEKRNVERLIKKDFWNVSI